MKYIYGGRIGATFPTSSPAMAGTSISLYKPVRPLILQNSNDRSSKYLQLCHLPLARSGIMAQPETHDHSPENYEPAPKVPKLHQNGTAGFVEESAPFFRVVRLSEKAILPSRASPLSAGYDLSRCVVLYSGDPSSCFFMSCDSDWGFSFSSCVDLCQC